MCRETIRVLLGDHDLRPWREKMWCIPALDEEYIERMEDLLDLYERPPCEDEPVVCLDERPIALHGEKRERLPHGPGKPTRIDYEYVRRGTANIVFAVEPLAGSTWRR